MTDDGMKADLELLAEIKSLAEKVQSKTSKLHSKRWRKNIWYCLNDAILNCNYAREDILGGNKE